MSEGENTAYFSDGTPFEMNKSQEVDYIDTAESVTETLFKRLDGTFVLVRTSTVVDGVELDEDEDAFSTYPELKGVTAAAIQRRFQRLERKHTAQVIDTVQAAAWAIRCFIPEPLKSLVAPA